MTKSVLIINIGNVKFYQLTWQSKQKIIHRIVKYYKSKRKSPPICTVENAARIFDTQQKQAIILSKVIFKEKALAFDGNFIALTTPDIISDVFLSRYLPPGKMYMIKTQEDLINFLMSQDIGNFENDYQSYLNQADPYSLAEDITQQVIECIPTITPPQTDEDSDTVGAPQGVWYENWYQNLPEGTKQYQPPTHTKVSNRSSAGVKAAALRKQIAAYTSAQGETKNYISLNRTMGGGLRVPKSFVSKWLHKAPGATVLIVGSKGIKPYSAHVKNDGSIYIQAEKLSGFTRNVFQIRAEVNDNGKYTLIIK